MTLVCCAFVIYLEILIFFIILQLKWTNSSLLSRFRYPNEYIAPPEATFLPADLPEDIYQTLIEDRPDLEPLFAPYRTTKLRRPTLPYLRKNKLNGDPNSPVFFEYEFKGFEPEKGQKEDQRFPKPQKDRYYKYNNMTSRTVVYNYRSLNETDVNGSDRSVGAPLQNDIGGRRIFWAETPSWDNAKSPKVGRCYTCGLHEGDVPRTTLCHDMFNSDDWRKRTLARYYRTVCHFNIKFTRAKKMIYYWNYKSTFWIENDRGLKGQRMGGYLAGCYKRYVDIGNGHTVRGCRHYKSEYAEGLSNSRFKRLELLLSRQKDKCISSAHASLTVFSRAVSLYARYHVCVCSKKYCNRSITNNAKNSSMFIILLILKRFI